MCTAVNPFDTADVGTERVAPAAGRRYVSASVLLYLLVRRGMFDPADLLKRPPHNELLSLLAVSLGFRF
jgi:hypothetical protein